MQKCRNPTDEVYDMIIPIRCFSCGKPIAQVYEEYTDRVTKGQPAKDVLDDLGLDRYCCRAMILGQVDLIDQVSRFKKY